MSCNHPPAYQMDCKHCVAKMMRERLAKAVSWINLKYNVNHNINEITELAASYE